MKIGQLVTYQMIRIFLTQINQILQWIFLMFPAQTVSLFETKHTSICVGGWREISTLPAWSFSFSELAFCWESLCFISLLSNPPIPFLFLLHLPLQTVRQEADITSLSPEEQPHRLLKSWAFPGHWLPSSPRSYC